MADISKINPNGTEYNLKDATARAGIESSKTIKSSVVTVTDAAPINAEDITVDITPIQDLHGYDRPWAGGAWKNKLPTTVAGIKAINTSGTWNGNVYTIRNGTFEILVDSDNNVVGIKVNGTPNANIFFHLWDTASVVEGDTINGCPSGGSFSTYRLICALSGTGIGIDTGNGASITQTANNCTVEIRITSGTVMDNKVFYPMISTEGGAFAPYSNICPIEGRTGAELDRVGKNWFDKNNMTSNMAFNREHEYVTANEVSSCFIRIEEGDLLTISGLKNWGTGFKNCFCDANKNWLEDAGNRTSGSGGIIEARTITAPNNARYYCVCAYTGSADYTLYQDKDTIQVELGSTPTAYEPYQGEQYTASFGETVYGGKWHVTAGGTDKTMKVVDLGTLAWGKTSAGYFYSDGIRDFKQVEEISGYIYGNAICSHYPYVTEDVSKSTSDNVFTLYFEIQRSFYRLFIRDDTKSASMTSTDFKQAMSGVQLVYELETPTTISTPKQNVPMLKGINTVSADCGDTQLKYQPDNVIGELKGEIQVANSFVDKMALRQGSGAKDFSYGGWSFRIRIFRSMGQISLYVENISASNVTEQAIVKVFMDTSDYRAPEELRPRMNIVQAATYTTPSGWAIQVYLKDDGYIMFTGVAPEVGASAPTSSNWNLVEPWAAHQQAKDLFNN